MRKSEGREIFAITYLISSIQENLDSLLTKKLVTLHHKKYRFIEYR